MLQSFAKKSIRLMVTYKKQLLWAFLGVLTVTLIATPLTSMILEFMFGGHIPGTDVVVPYWAMFTAYVGALLAMILLKIEDLFYTHEAVKKHASRRRTTRRRYSHS
jgi:hypothetical protein